MREIANNLERQNVAQVYEELEEIDIGNAWTVLDEKETKKFEKWLEAVKETLYESMREFDAAQLITIKNSRKHGA